MITNNKELFTKSDLIFGRFGLEKEALRITSKGEIASTDHPAVFGDRTMHPYITTDFAESQVEIITGVHDTLTSAHSELEMINETVLRTIGDELLWPYSMPPKFDWKNVKVAEYPDSEAGRSAQVYREYLLEKYGNNVQLISGIHYNFSFSDALVEKLFVKTGAAEFKTFKNDFYMAVAKKYVQFYWVLVYFLGKTPIAEGIDETGSISLRNSKYGYQNLVDLDLSYDSLCAHGASIRKAVASGKIIDEREIYAPVRVKCPNKVKLMDCVEAGGIGYLEIRSLDLNPTASAGITLAELQFVHLFMLSLLDVDIDGEINGLEIAKRVALSGELTESECEIMTLVHQKMVELNEMFDLELLAPEFEVIQSAKGIADLDFLALAVEHKDLALEKVYQVHGLADMEMSSQLLIAESVRRGVKYEVIDRKENFLRLETQLKREYVKQATKTSLDTYVSYLAMENKEVTKIILADAGFPVPAGNTYQTVDQAMGDFGKYDGKEVVIKPKSTNFGLGIVMFRPLTSEDEFQKALEIAFGFDDEVLVEEFLHGQEYRFLVVGDECIAVLQRIGANVVGDGSSTISELVAAKNEHIWRGENHRAPLEIIKLGEIELHNLKQAGLSPESVMADGQKAILRDNSNISTGGDSIDQTPVAHDFFKAQAVGAAHAIGARICGVDMIINGDLSDASASYGFIELNFNPAIHMHAFTLEGDGVNAAPYVLKALGLV